MATLKTVAVLLLLKYICLCAASYDGVPALIWTNVGIEFDNPLAGHITRTEEFQRDYLEKVVQKSGHSLVAFVQDKLSLEDIIDNADVYNEHSTGAKFANLKNLVETYTSVHLPSVAAPGDAVDRLASQFQGQIHHLKSPFNIKDLKIDPASSNLVICHLPSNNGKNFDKIDGIIGAVSSDLKTLGVSFTAFYTGRSASKSQEDESQYLGRHLLAENDAAAEEPSFSFYNSTDCIYVYFERMFFDIIVVNKDLVRETKFSAALPNGRFGKAECANDSSTGSLSISIPSSELKNISGLEQLDVKMNFTFNNLGYWRAILSVTYDVKKSVNYKGENVEIEASSIYAPKKFSYHCSDVVFTLDKRGSMYPKILPSLRFDQLQVQFKNIEKGKFGYPNDCQGFFSVTILSGLMAGVILASILAFGICMIVNITTMDRFDDPKGKTITVNVADS